MASYKRQVNSHTGGGCWRFPDVSDLHNVNTTVNSNKPLPYTVVHVVHAPCLHNGM